MKKRFLCFYGTFCATSTAQVGPPHKAGQWYKKIGARVNLDQNDPENNDGEVRFWIGVAKSCARAFK